MSNRPKPVAALAKTVKSSTPVAISPTPLKRHRWQLLAAGVMLALWIIFLIVMAIYS